MLRNLFLALLLCLTFIHTAQAQETVIFDATVVIPLAYETPWDTYVENDQQTWYNMEYAIDVLDTYVYDFTNGQADIDVTVEYVDIATPDMFSYVEGYYVSPLAFSYDTDFLFVITDPDTATTWYKGLTSYPQSGTWVLGYNDADNVILHELGHMIEIELNNLGYYLPACSDLPASLVHCGTAYGFPNDHVMSWMEYFYQLIPSDAWTLLNEGL